MPRLSRVSASKHGSADSSSRSVARRGRVGGRAGVGGCAGRRRAARRAARSDRAGRPVPPCRGCGQACRAWRRSARAAGRSPASRWVRRRGQGQPGIESRWPGVSKPASARRSGPWCAGEDQRDGEAVQQLRQQRRVAAAGGVVEGVDRLVLVGPPAGGGGVQLGGPGGSLALQVGEQVGAQQLLDAVGVAVLSGRRSAARSGGRAGRAGCRRLPGRTAAAASPDGTGSLMLITRRNSCTSSGSAERISPTR